MGTEAIEQRLLDRWAEYSRAAGVADIAGYFGVTSSNGGGYFLNTGPFREAEGDAEGRGLPSTANWLIPLGATYEEAEAELGRQFQAHRRQMEILRARLG